MKKLHVIFIGIIVLSSALFADSKGVDKQYGGGGFNEPVYSHFGVTIYNKTTQPIQLGIFDAHKNGIIGFGQEHSCSQAPITLPPNCKMYRYITWKLNETNDRRDVNAAGFTINGSQTLDKNPYCFTFKAYPNQTKYIDRHYHYMSFPGYEAEYNYKSHLLVISTPFDIEIYAKK